MDVTRQYTVQKLIRTLNMFSLGMDGENETTWSKKSKYQSAKNNGPMKLLGERCIQNIENV